LRAKQAQHFGVLREPVRVEKKIGVDQKSEPVTVADHIANELNRRRAPPRVSGRRDPGRESVDTARRLSKQRVWMIDPLDGTNGFIARDGDFAVQIGLTVGGELCSASCTNPYLICSNRATIVGAWVERSGFSDERLKVSDRTDLSHMRLAASRSHRSPRMDTVVRALNVTEEVSARVRRCEHRCICNSKGPEKSEQRRLPSRIIWGAPGVPLLFAVTGGRTDPHCFSTIRPIFTPTDPRRTSSVTLSARTTVSIRGLRLRTAGSETHVGQNQYDPTP